MTAEQVTPGVDKEATLALLREEWAVLADLLDSLDEEAWARPALPGWDVHAVVAHMIGTERSLAGDDPAPPLADAEERPHVRNPIAAGNEAWVELLRGRSGVEMAADFRAVTAARMATLEGMTQEEFDAPSWTPAGQATYGHFMQIRVFDFWVHEQDIRDVVGVPGHEDGPAAERSLEQIVDALGYVVGKRGRAPDGSSVTFSLTGPIERELHVAVDGRARVVDALDGPPTAVVECSSSVFMRLAAGRVEFDDVRDQVALDGDVALAEQLASNLAFTI